MTQIREELQNKPFPTICESMDKLDIAISFMKSIGANQDESLSDFIVQTLKMDRTFASSKVKSLYVNKAKILFELGKDFVFDTRLREL